MTRVVLVISMKGRDMGEAMPQMRRGDSRRTWRRKTRELCEVFGGR